MGNFVYLLCYRDNRKVSRPTGRRICHFSSPSRTLLCPTTEKYIIKLRDLKVKCSNTVQLSFGSTVKNMTPNADNLKLPTIIQQH